MKDNDVMVGKALAWSNKHQKLEGEGVRVAHIKQLLVPMKMQYLDDIITWLITHEGATNAEIADHIMFLKHQVQQEYNNDLSM